MAYTVFQVAEQEFSALIKEGGLDLT